MWIITPIESFIVTQKGVKTPKIFDIMFFIHDKSLYSSQIIFTLMLDYLFDGWLNINRFENLKFPFVNKVDNSIITDRDKMVLLLQNIRYAIRVQMFGINQSQCFRVEGHERAIPIPYQYKIGVGMDRS